MEASYILIKGAERRRVEARSLLCYWAVKELGMTVTQLAKRFEMRPSSITYAVRRGEKIALENGYILKN
jgi:hypothetical protein